MRSDLRTRSSRDPDTAFAEMYQRHAERIYAFCRRRLSSREEAEDAVQETFVAAMRSIKRGSVPICESAWLFKIAENVCFAAYRSGARRHARDLSDSARISRLPARHGDGDTLIGLEAALDTLPSKQRDALVLRELRGLSYKEIAAELGVSVPSVETLIYRARRGVVRGLENGAGLGRRVTAGLNLGSAISAVKAWFAGATAVKVASAASVAALASLAAGDVLQERRGQAETAAAQPLAAKPSPLSGAPHRSRRRAESSTRPRRRKPREARPETRAKPVSPGAKTPS
ncbi:MAG TPA: sigma-70 family RNA polymerase sigma factor, partial [Gaiellaceae bacterium]|nr:sigma-70 family RNA polymerase sigma factor [Gaiellaceae bacterium]